MIYICSPIKAIHSLKTIPGNKEKQSEVQLCIRVLMVF